MQQSPHDAFPRTGGTHGTLGTLGTVVTIGTGGRNPPRKRAAGIRAMSPRDARIRLRGETLFLLPERAACWRGEKTLLVADAHFGKAASFRASGVPVPRGTTGETLERLERALTRHRVERIVFLGDFLHSAAGRAERTLDALAAWRARHAQLALVLVRGNHDAHAGDPPAALGFQVETEPWSAGPFALCHEPGAAALGYEIAGHLHPAVRVSGRRDSIRLPCFWFARAGAVLPAFGSFTGSMTIDRAAADRVYAIAEDAVIRV